MNCIKITQAIVNQIDIDDRRNVIEIYEDYVWDMKHDWPNQWVGVKTPMSTGLQAFRLNEHLFEAFCDMRIESQVKYRSLKDAILDNIERETRLDRMFIRYTISDYLLSQGD